MEKNQYRKKQLRAKFGPDSYGRGWDSRFTINESLGREFDIAQYFLHQGFYKKALPIAMELEQKLPKHPYVLNLVGIILAQQDQITRASPRFKRALAQAPADSRDLLGMLWSNMGGVEYKLGEIEKAEESFKKSLDYDNTNPTAFANLGMIKLNKKRFLEAIPFFEAVVDLEIESSKPSNTLSGSVLSLIYCYKETRQQEKAEEMFKKLRKLPPEHAYFFLEGERPTFYNREMDTTQE